MKQIDEQINILKQKLSEFDFSQLDLESIKGQLILFINGVKIPELAKPCTLGDGIVKINELEFDELLNLHKIAAENSRLMKFVPASGAASRMFQKIQSVLSKDENFTLEDLGNKSFEDKESKAVYELLINLHKFAFYEDLKNIFNLDESGIEELAKYSPAKLLKSILFEAGLDYSSKPKGAINFHRYGNKGRTAFEEQIYESLNYIADKNNCLKIHFTISEEHKSLFVEIIEQLKLDFKNEFIIEVTFSFQKKSTDTIAVDNNNRILLDKSGNLIMRPAGHGALIENLNDLDSDIVVIKNIDNLSTENLSTKTILYKKLLTGYLVKLQNQIFDYLHLLEKQEIENQIFEDIALFTERYLFITKPAYFESWNKNRKQKFYFDKLNRPIRVCGMVKNEGEPGGGPFWIKAEDGSLSLQIIEQAQINMNDEKQKNIFKQSTHFNPVDLVCGIRDYKNNKFDLHKFVDHKSGIITKKSKDGIELKALELPGLWNGSMADWITVFVEVPISTFNPVKEINDLLRKEHQN
jgi:hypothetical protein